jgi:hypothetical protein
MDNVFLMEDNDNEEDNINENDIIYRQNNLQDGVDNRSGIYDIHNLIYKQISRENILLSNLDLDNSDGDVSHDSKTLKFDLSLNKSGGINYKKNIIGFRLNECIFTSPIFNIKKGINDTININLESFNYTITISEGFYTINTLLNTINNSTAIMNIIGVNILVNTIFSLTFDVISSIITLTKIHSSNIIFTPVMDSLIYKLGFHEDIYNNSLTISATKESDTHPALNIGTYIDIVVDEIPYGACKQNSQGLNILHRLPVRPESGSSIVYYRSNFIDHNYQHLFPPINLSQLTVHMYMDNKELNLKHMTVSFEFELVILNK